MAQHQTIWTGDNLPILRGLNSESIDLVYLDPPFNSKRTYSAPIGSKAAGTAFKDTWTLSDVKNEWHGELAESAPAIYHAIAVSEATQGKSMKAYLIMMAIRLLELKRILKPTGSIYLHCDTTAVHYLKTLMDAIFGASNFRNEIVWRRVSSTQKGSQHKPKSWGNNADTILFYSKSDQFTLKPYGALDEEEAKLKFDKVDENGRAYYDDSAHIWSTPAMDERPNLCYEWRGFKNPHPSGWRLSKERLEEEYQKGNIVITLDKKLERRKYEDDYEGTTLGNIWTDIKRPAGKEYVGFRTQKPLALLERIIGASSNEGDFVLDPFCGCATTLVAAERLERKWIGIDISPKAVDLIKLRMRDEEDLWARFNPIPRKDIPKRTDIKTQKLKASDEKRFLFGKQHGYCNGCKRFFEFRNLTVDHILPRVKGGQDNIENKQLLCGSCNSIKGVNTQEDLIVKLKKAKIIK